MRQVTSVTARRAAWRRGAGTGPDARRVLQLVLAGIWLLDAALQWQRSMFTKAFGGTLAATASGNPAVIADPITWVARLVGDHPVALNAVFATIQLLLGLGITWRRTLRLALGASIAWALGVWWLGEGLGGLLNGTANPAGGAPGAVVLYALLAALLWPADRPGPAAPFTAARAVGTRTARTLWLVLWAVLASVALWPANRAPWALRDMIAGMGSGEPGWLAATERNAAALVGNRGLAASVVLAVLLALVAIAVYLPKPAARAGIVLAIMLAAGIWVVGEALGGVLTGSGTDPNTGPLLAILALSYWPAPADRMALAAANVGTSSVSTVPGSTTLTRGMAAG